MSPGTCVTVNAHSLEHCETLSLSMTDITHSRTSRCLLRIPYGNAALGAFRGPCTCEIGTTINVRALPLLRRTALSQESCRANRRLIASSNADENLFTLDLEGRRLNLKRTFDFLSRENARATVSVCKVNRCTSDVCFKRLNMLN